MNSSITRVKVLNNVIEKMYWYETTDKLFNTLLDLIERLVGDSNVVSCDYRV